MKNIKGGIIAAGQGQRFKQQGVTGPKALISVFGKPLLRWSVSRFINVGIDKVAVILNKNDCQICTDYINNIMPSVNVDILCKNTLSSFESFYEILLTGQDEYFLITTVDSIFEPERFRTFLQKVREIPPQALALGISNFIEDEKPLYIDIDNQQRVLSLGQDKSPFVTCGVYFLHSSLVHHVAERNYSSLRMFLKDLVNQGVPTYGVPMGKSIDVDHPHDVYRAEEFLRDKQVSGKREKII